MITNVPGFGPVDDSITPGLPGGPPVIVPPGGDSPPSVIPDASTAVTFNQDAPGTNDPPLNPII